VQQIEAAACPTTLSEQQQLKNKMGFHYRQVIGEVIYPMMKARPDICFHATKLSQYMENPGEQHYIALRTLCTYLAHTIQDGIYYWRNAPRPDLPQGQLPTLHADNHEMIVRPEQHNGMLYGYVDADWASDTTHRKSISGIVVMYAGGAVGYKSKYQENIAHSTTEAEFTAACDAAKQILFFRSVLDEMKIEQHHATKLYEDNAGALLMANAQQPTRRTRHMDIKKFALLDWVQEDLLLLQTIKTSDNAADNMMKILGPQLFHRHTDTIMGRRLPLRLQRNGANTSGYKSCSKTHLKDCNSE
jgi:hypothetical protein